MVPYSKIDVADSSVAQMIVASVELMDASTIPEITGGVVSVCSVIVTVVVAAAVAATVLVAIVAFDVAVVETEVLETTDGAAGATAVVKL